MEKKLLFLAVFYHLVSVGISPAQHWMNYTTENSGLADNEVRAICVDNYNAKWFGTGNGLTRFDGESWKTFTTHDSLANNSVKALAFELTDHGPEIWVATDGGVSVMSVEPDVITFATPYRTDNTGLISDTVSTVAVDEYHVKWFGTDSGVSGFDGSTWTSFTVEKDYYIKSNTILSIYSVKGVWTYFGTADGGVSRFDGVTQATPYLMEDYDIASNTVFAIYVTGKENEWFGTDVGLSHHTSEWPENDWVTYTTEDGLADNTVRSIMADEDSVLWIGTDNGLSRFDGDEWTTYTTNDGLAGNTVYAIATDNDGVLWFGTDSGVSQYIPNETSVEIDPSEPFALSIETAYPNPFNMNTSISFHAPSEGFIELGIYNLTGQRIRRLVSFCNKSGSQLVVWDGCDGNGSSVSSGVYIARLRMGRYVAATKLTIIR